MCHFGVHAYHLGVVQRLDKGEHGADGGQVEVAAWLVGLRLQGKTQPVALILDVACKKVEYLPKPLQRIERTFAGICLGALSPTPDDVRLGAQFGAQVDGAHGLLQRIGAHSRVVAREGPVAEGGVGEQIRGCHRHDQPGLAERLTERRYDPVTLGRRSIDRDEVVVVQVDAVGAEPGQQVDERFRRAGRAYGRAERVAPDVADCPQAEGEAMIGRGTVWVSHMRGRADRERAELQEDKGARSHLLGRGPALACQG